jgi:GNAT superfamily N-acetyltransferase
MIKTLEHPDELIRLLPVIQTLRPHVNEQNIRSLIGGMLERGYHLLYAEENGIPTAFCGYRHAEHLAWGRVLYIDDLGTHPDYRGRGCASALLEQVFEIAHREGLDGVHLDSGSVPARYDAHRLYLKKGFNITSFHFAKDLR